MSSLRWFESCADVRRYQSECGVISCSRCWAPRRFLDAVVVSGHHRFCISLRHLCLWLEPSASCSDNGCDVCGNAMVEMGICPRGLRMHCAVIISVSPVIWFTNDTWLSSYDHFWKIAPSKGRDYSLGGRSVVIRCSEGVFRSNTLDPCPLFNWTRIRDCSLTRVRRQFESTIRCWNRSRQSNSVSNTELFARIEYRF